MAPISEQSGKPIQLISFDEDTRRFVVHQDAADVILAIQKPVAVVAAAGRSRTGKSYLLNRLVKKDSNTPGFTVASSSKAVTAGIWLWSTPLDVGSHSVIVLDTEGLDDTENDDDHDSNILSLAMLLSSFLMWVLNFSIHFMPVFA